MVGLLDFKFLGFFQHHFIIQNFPNWNVPPFHFDVHVTNSFQLRRVTGKVIHGERLQINFSRQILLCYNLSLWLNVLDFTFRYFKGFSRYLTNLLDPIFVGLLEHYLHHLSLFIHLLFVAFLVLDYLIMGQDFDWEISSAGLLDCRYRFGIID